MTSTTSSVRILSSKLSPIVLSLCLLQSSGALVEDSVRRLDPNRPDAQAVADPAVQAMETFPATLPGPYPARTGEPLGPTEAAEPTKPTQPARPTEPAELPMPAEPEGDWLVAPVKQRARLERGTHRHEVVMTNGLVRRAWRLLPDAATVAYDNLMTGASILRGVKPEAVVVVDGERIAVGGLLGQPEYAYLRREWIDAMAADPAALRCTGVDLGRAEPRFPWKRQRYSAELPWPPPGVSLTLRFEARPEMASSGVPGEKAAAKTGESPAKSPVERPPGRPAEGRNTLKGLVVSVHYEIYDGIPLLSKWLTVENKTGRAVRLDTFTSEILAAVEHESSVENPGRWEHPNLHVECDYAFLGSDPHGAQKAVHWVPDPQYTTQVNYKLETPAMLECRPPIGPDLILEPGAVFESFRAFELVLDGTGRERNGLALRRMYRTIAPWVTENPILMHVRSADPESVRRAVDQCAAVGFELVIMTFGSGFDIESEDPAYIAQVKDLVDYAHSKGVELGGYSLLASRRISDEEDAINPQTGKPGGAIFGNSPCLMSRWGDEYFRKVKSFIERTGIDVLEHDGSYPGDVCASVRHPGHRGLKDSQWMQWKRITEFYRWCRGRGVYLNVPDWYFLQGSSKTAMGYRETNWSLPRERQLILGRQNIFDGTWQKTPSMGWMFVPLVEYQGGGSAATLEPLRDHLDAYGQHLAQNFGAGVQACYRGPRLYDSEETRAVVARWAGFYRKHRQLLDSDIVHVRRPDGRDYDAILHVNPQLSPRALAMVYNPLDEPIRRTIPLPLYYAGAREPAVARERDGEPREYVVDRRGRIRVEVEIPARGLTWLAVE